jgi:hypothetical protein
MLKSLDKSKFVPGTLVCGTPKSDGSIISHRICYHIGIIFVEGVLFFDLNLVIEFAIIATVATSHIICGFLPHMGTF